MNEAFRPTQQNLDQIKTLEAQGRDHMHVSLDVASVVLEKMKSIPQNAVIAQGGAPFDRLDSIGSAIERVPSTSSRAEEKKKAEIAGTMNELIALEQNFCDHVGSIVRVCTPSYQSKHILDAEKKPENVSQYEMDMVFKVFRDLHSHSRVVLSSMKRARDGEFVKMGGSSLTGQYAVAAVFCKHVLEFGVYNRYVQNYCHAKRKLEELLLTKKGFEKWFKGVLSKPDFKRMDVDCMQ